MSKTNVPFDFEKGEILLINKPKTWTSFDVVKKIRFATKQKKVGHAGTLDPLAEGLLIIAVGKATKLLNDIQGLNKEYDGIIEIGKTTPSYDLETEFDSESPFDNISNEDLQNTAEKLSGWIDQVPPIYSAIKKDGERAYKKARKGLDIELKSRNVNIESTPPSPPSPTIP